MDVSKEILSDIADSLEAGFKCFIHRDTQEVVTYFDQEQNPGMDPAAWKAEASKVRKNKKKFIEIEAMTSFESFRVMEEFIDNLDNNSTKVRLLKALEGRNPFANFKFQIESSRPYREKWFDFRRRRNIEWINEQLSAVHH